MSARYYSTKASGPIRRNRASLAASVLLLSICSWVPGVAAIQNEAARELVLNAPVEGDLRPGETHSYNVALSAGDYLRLFVNPTQQAIKVTSRLFAPTGSDDVGTYFWPTHGEERFISLIAGVSGNYRLELRSDENTAKPQHYELKIEELHSATEQDRFHLAAEASEYQGSLLVRRMLAEPVEVWRQGLLKYEESLALWRKCGDQKSELRLLQSLGNNYLFLGETETAIDYFNQAIRLSEEVGDTYRRANLIVSFGAIYQGLGESQKALDSYNQAKSLFKASGKKYGEAIAAKNVGIVHLQLGDYQDALSYLEEALPTVSSMGDHRSEGIILFSMGQIHRFFGDQQKALDDYNRALSVAKSTKEDDIAAICLRLLGDIKAELGEYQAAIELYQRSADSCSALGQHKGEAAALNGIGDVAHLLGDEQKSLSSLNQALVLSRSMRERLMESKVLASLSKVNYSLGNVEEARKEIEQALEIRESMRANVINQNLREDFFSSTQKSFALYIDLLMQLHQMDPKAGHEGEALQANERARARSLLEILSESQADIREGVPGNLLELERSLEQQINGKAAARNRVLSGEAKENQAAYFDKGIAALTLRLREVEAQIRQSSPRYSALTQPQPLSATGIQQQLDDETVLLEFALGEKRSWLWAVTNRSINSYQLRSSKEIEASARRVYELLIARQLKGDETETQYRTRFNDADSRFQTESSTLSQMLLGPIAEKLAKEWKDKRLAIVATGSLEYIPFAALPTPTSVDKQNKATIQSAVAVKSPIAPPLVIEHEIVNLPSASALAAIRNESVGRKMADKSVAVFADPVFETSDQRVIDAMRKRSSNLRASTRSGGELRGPVDSGATLTSNSDLLRSLRSFTFAGSRNGFSRLPFSREEAEAISALTPKESLMKATDFQANRANAISGELSHYRIIHFATHGLLNSEHPELSGLVLSLLDERRAPQDGFLRMHEIYNLHLPADLIVLSACQTALGKEIKGEGLVGVTRGFMYAGALRVVASLWQVDDLATAHLMKGFYRGMLKEGLRPAQALRLAQLEMIKQPRWSSPYFWAPFIIQGEWR